MAHTDSGFILIYTSTDANSVHLAKALLESENIPSTMEGEILNQVMMGYQGTTWVKLFVPKSKAEAAREILSRAGFAPEEDKAEVPEDETAKYFYARKGKNITLIILGILAVLATLAIYTYLVQ